MLLTESPTVGVFLFLVWLSYFRPAPCSFWAVDWLFFPLLCVSMSCGVIAVSKARCLSCPAGWHGSGFQLLYIRFPLDVIGVGACEPRVKDHFFISVKLTRPVYMPRITIPRYPEIVAWTLARFLQVYL